MNTRLEVLAAGLSYVCLTIALWLYEGEGYRGFFSKCLCILLLLSIFTPVLNMFGPFYLLVRACFAGSYQASGWISGQNLVDGMVSYQLNADQSLIGGAEYTSYTIYKSPAWFPLIRKEIESGSMDTWRGGPVTLRRDPTGKLEVVERHDLSPLG